VPQLGWAGPAPDIPPASLGHATRSVTILSLEWLFYFLAWVLMATPLDWVQAVTLSLYYSLAAFAGALTVVMPSGLMVREAGFLGLGILAGFPADQLILLGVLARLALTVADLVTATAVTVFSGVIAARPAHD
jgi:hypothetical protein